MPELPEIETVKLQLDKALGGAEITGIRILNEKTVRGEGKQCEGRKITGIRRKGKGLIIDLEGDLAAALHFKMTGQLVLVRGGENKRIAGGHPTADFTGELPSKHTRVMFETNRGELFFNDQRKFGWIKIGNREEIEKEPFFAGLGPEPFDIPAGDFRTIARKSKRPIKLLIMDQAKISGVGNIYANDALWEAKIHPKTQADKLSDKQLTCLLGAINKVLREGIKYGGATAADDKYVNLHGLGGRYQEHFRVYDREGEKCRRGDGGTIQKITLGGRGTYFCAKCQKPNGRYN